MTIFLVPADLKTQMDEGKPENAASKGSTPGGRRRLGELSTAGGRKAGMGGWR